MNQVIFYDFVQYDFISYKHSKTFSKELTNFTSHAHVGHEILYVIEGNPTCGYEGNSINLKPGDVLIIPPQLYHFLQVTPGCNYERISIVLYPNKFNEAINLDKVLLLSNNHKLLQRQLKAKYF